MIFLLLLALLFSPSNGVKVNSPISLIAHLSDFLKLKCDSLLYRSAYIGTRCYFAVTKEVKYDEASTQCALIFPGSQASNASCCVCGPGGVNVPEEVIALNAPESVFNTIMVDKSKVHVGKDSSGAKQTICVYESGYKCEIGEQSPIISGKCIDVNEEKKDLKQALAYCKRQEMELPAVGSELENQMIRSAVGTNPVWIRNIYKTLGANKWFRDKQYGRYSTCDRPNPRLYAGSQMGDLCNKGASAVVDKTGYWGMDWDATKTGWANVCIKDAENDFTPDKKPCIALHEWDAATNRCKWTGPKDSCLQLIDYKNKTLFVPIPNFPKDTYTMFNLVGTAMNDQVYQAIVRKGCMFTGYSGGPTAAYGVNELIMDGNLCRGYGAVNVPCYYTGDLKAGKDGLSRVTCFCDPTEATLNGHVPAPPPDRKCIEHHIFNETTQQCEWQHDAKYCAELITFDGRRKMLEIPNWPKNRKYDDDHWRNLKKQPEDFHFKITEVIVRQHCWATMYWRKIHERRTLNPSGYGRHEVASFYNKKLNTAHLGTTRVVCECLH